MKFRFGDPVRVIATPCRWFDQVGTIRYKAAGQFQVRGLDSGPLWFFPHELVLAKHPKEMP